VKLSARVRRVYYDAIVRGEKTTEFRADKAFWSTRVHSLMREHEHDGSLTVGERVVFHEPRPSLVLVCGHEKHEREIVSLAWFTSAEEGLGREPSEQGRQDLGEGPVYGFDLGRTL